MATATHTIDQLQGEEHPMTQASSGTPRAKQTAGARGILANARGAHSPSAITRITFGVMDIEKR